MKTFLNHKFRQTILQNIFSYLQVPDLLAVKTVNKRWNMIVCDDQIWKPIFFKHYGGRKDTTENFHVHYMQKMKNKQQFREQQKRERRNRDNKLLRDQRLNSFEKKICSFFKNYLFDFADYFQLEEDETQYDDEEVDDESPVYYVMHVKQKKLKVAKKIVQVLSCILLFVFCALLFLFFICFSFTKFFAIFFLFWIAMGVLFIVIIINLVMSSLISTEDWKKKRIRFAIKLSVQSFPIFFILLYSLFAAAKYSLPVEFPVYWAYIYVLVFLYYLFIFIVFVVRINFVWYVNPPWERVKKSCLLQLLVQFVLVIFILSFGASLVLFYISLEFLHNVVYFFAFFPLLIPELIVVIYAIVYIIYNIRVCKLMKDVRKKMISYVFLLVFIVVTVFSHVLVSCTLYFGWGIFGFGFILIAFIFINSYTKNVKENAIF